VPTVAFPLARTVGVGVGVCAPTGLARASPRSTKIANLHGLPPRTEMLQIIVYH